MATFPSKRLAMSKNRAFLLATPITHTHYQCQTDKTDYMTLSHAHGVINHALEQEGSMSYYSLLGITVVHAL